MAYAMGMKAFFNRYSQLFITSLLMLLWSAAAWAALPPLSAGDLNQQADLVVVGVVQCLDSNTVELDYGKNRVYEYGIEVDLVEKGSLEANSLKAICWQPLERPQLWTGDQGQNELPEHGQRIRLYLQRNADGSYQMLAPNGWESYTK